MNILHALDYVTETIRETMQENAGEDTVMLSDLEHTNISISLSYIDENGMKNAKVFENFREGL